VPERQRSDPEQQNQGPLKPTFLYYLAGEPGSAYQRTYLWLLDQDQPIRRGDSKLGISEDNLERVLLRKGRGPGTQHRHKPSRGGTLVSPGSVRAVADR